MIDDLDRHIGSAYTRYILSLTLAPTARRVSLATMKEYSAMRVYEEPLDMECGFSEEVK